MNSYFLYQINIVAQSDSNLTININLKGVVAKIYVSSDKASRELVSREKDV